MCVCVSTHHDRSFGVTVMVIQGHLLAVTDDASVNSPDREGFALVGICW